MNPKRTCIGCKMVTEKSRLVRIICIGQEVQADPLYQAPGRGAYICPSLECLEKATQKKAFTRAFGTTARPTEMLRHTITQKETFLKPF